ncbi:ATP F0F1 synthase synthase [Dickeya zeae]|uniref:ATP F0F1 synthase synthase n=1 Tax=Dickeya zeae TaxID=204042 RepID=UPI001CFB5C88|nr:ATP F0F1 synthase synthase [Dickeya zeae]UCZ75721.1 ATP F0F1 synthase synthase [Dickeya zeae]
MNNVFAKVKKLRKNPYLKLLSDCTLYSPVVVTDGNCVVYNPDHNLDEEAWFKIEGFSEQSYCLDILKVDFDSKEFLSLTKTQFSSIAYIMSVQDGDFYFQKVTPSQMIRKKTLSFGDAVVVENNDNRLVINEFPDAIYFKDDDILIFRDLATISSIFQGIDILFKEATEEEVTQFLSESFINLSQEYDVNKVSKPNRKRVALAMDTLATLSSKEKVEMLGYINNYCREKVSFDSETKTFSITSDDELKYLLYGIEQRFYTTPFGKEKRLANSVQII